MFKKMFAASFIITVLICVLKFKILKKMNYG